MSGQNFIDYVKIFFKSGDGGPGSTHFYRAKYIPKGGPDGGNGGRGGHIILRGNRNLWTLLPLKYKKHIKADSGMTGMGNNKSGSDGQDIIVDVPLGTVAKSAESAVQEAEITTHGQEIVFLEGGRGGLGNANFKTATNQAPRYSQPGEKGSEGWKILELKVLADVGLIGFPNAGKSTLLSVITAAKPKIASYAFTTLVPNLGIVQYRENRSFIMADIPGIIEKAHEGKGLGHRFLRHIERNAALLFMVPCDSDDIEKEYGVLLNELQMYNPELLDKPRLLAITKCDIVDEEWKEMLKESFKEGLPEIVFISSIAHQGLGVLKDKIWNLLESW